MKTWIRNNWKTLAIVGAVFLVGIGIGVSANRTQTDRQFVTQTVTVGKVKNPKPATVFSDGSYLVGKDIAVGAYFAPGGKGCYWQQSSDPTSVSTNWTNSAQVTMSVKGGEHIKTEGCGKWRLGELVLGGGP